VLILGSPRHRGAFPLVGEEEDDGCGGGALGAEHERSGEDSNDLSRIILPPLRIRPSPYILR
jgi:hypothetical protein